MRTVPSLRMKRISSSSAPSTEGGGLSRTSSGFKLAGIPMVGAGWRPLGCRRTFRKGALTRMPARRKSQYRCFIRFVSQRSRAGCPCARGQGLVGRGHCAKSARVISLLTLLLTVAPRRLHSPLLHKQLGLEPMVGIEPTTYGLRNRCSTAELHWLPNAPRQYRQVGVRGKKKMALFAGLN